MIKIVADSTCDLSPEIIEKTNITISPTYVVSNDKYYKDGVDIAPEDVFKIFETEGAACKTTAANVYDYEEIYSEYASEYDDIIQICIGSEFSCCYQNACIAAKSFKNVHVINSVNLSTGFGYLVYEAALMAKDGTDAETICKKIEGTVPYIDTSFVINKLDYLYKGGRCSGLEAIGAMLFNIKPCIEVLNGKMDVGRKYRGKLEQCIEKYIKDRFENNGDIDYKRVFVTHSLRSDEILNNAIELIKGYANFEEIITTTAGCAVSTHCGPNTLGVIYKRKTPKK